MAGIKIESLPRVDDEAILSAMSHPVRRLRLKSLNTDPQSFHSRYSSEVKEPPAFWINRLRDETAEHWLAYDTTDKDNLSPYESEIGGKMIAFLVVLSDTEASLNAETDNAPVCEYYQLGALYVDPDYRQHGLATKLMNAAIGKLNNASEHPTKKVIVMLQVRETNGNAIRLYKKLGFVTHGQEIKESDGGEKHVFKVMRLELVPSLSGQS